MSKHGLTPAEIKEFQERILAFGKELYRDLPWRNTQDPYLIFLSEVMLQQTQVSRVEKMWGRFTQQFPTLESLATTPLAALLEAWQGMGYNRRAVSLKRAAEQCWETYGQIPSGKEELLALPGIGPATSAGVRIFAFNIPDMYLETNVRSVFLHEFFPDEDSVADSLLIPLVETTCLLEDSRTWYYSLFDYGTHLKRILPNPSRRSKTYTRQSKFEGSTRQKRAALLRILLEDAGYETDFYTLELSREEEAQGRSAVDFASTEALLTALAEEGFLFAENGKWFVA